MFMSVKTLSCMLMTLQFGYIQSNGIEEFQISITGACTGKLDEIIVHLIPLLTPVSAQNK